MTKPKLGFTYPTVTGENQTQAFRRVLSEFPNLQLWSHYYSGNDLPTWTEPWFTEVPPDCVFLISVKHTNVSSIGNRIAVLPEHLRGRVVIFLHHEPDQWTEEDPKGDPAPWVWIQRQVDFANLREHATWRLWIHHWVCFTEDRYRRHTEVWEQNWGDTIKVEPRIDGAAFDCFNIGRSITRAGADIFAKPLEFARREDRPLIIREYGQVVPVDTALDSHAVADQIRENWEYAKAQHAIDGRPYALVWYYNHNNVLTDPSGQRPGRPLTRAALEEILVDATTPDQDPCCAQVDELEAQVAELTAQVALSHAAGRAEAFAEVAAWAQTQT